MSDAAQPIADALREAGSILLTAPVDLDGDAIGAIWGLTRLLEKGWPDKRVRILCDDARFPERYRFLAGAAERFEHAGGVAPEPVDLAVVLDGGPSRIGCVAPHFQAARRTGQIDHHKSARPGDADVPFLTTWSSASEMVIAVADALERPLDAEIAEALYAGMIFDTNAFRYELTTPETLRAAARLLETGIAFQTICEQVLMEQPRAKQKLRARLLERIALAGDGGIAWATLGLEEIAGVEVAGLIDDLIFLQGVRCAALLLERPEGQVKISLRSRGDVDCAAVAQALSPEGGGHARAAGLTLRASPGAAAERVVAALESALSG